MFRAETELSKAVARQTYPLDGGNAALAPALRVQFEIPDGVIIPTAPEVRKRGWGTRMVQGVLVGVTLAANIYGVSMTAMILASRTSGGIQGRGSIEAVFFVFRPSLTKTSC